MGLDMYLTGEKFFPGFGKNKRRMEDGFEVESHTLAIGYWRKHPNLHGYIVQTFADGRDECQRIELSADDMRAIIQAIEENRLPHTEGFFFGQSDDGAIQRKRDTAIFRKAIEWLESVKQPLKREPEPIAPGIAVLEIKPDDYNDAKDWRSVVYRASW